MAHPHADHRDHHVQHRRVAHITGGEMHGGRTIAPHVMASAKKRAAGGRVDAQRDAVAVTGKPPRQRLDRPMRARGGRTKHKGTTINIVAGGHPPVPPMAGAPVVPPGVPAVPPRPPISPTGVGAAPVPPPGAMPPGPIRQAGGRAYAKGGAVKSGPAWKGGLRSGTQVQHTGNKLDGHNVGRGKVVTFATGGAVEAKSHTRPTYKAGNPTEHPAHGHMGPKLPGGGKGGLGRLAKAKRAAKHG